MTRRHALLAARLGFIVVTLGFAWWGFDGRWGEIADDVGGTGTLRLLGAVVVTVGGLALTGVLWRFLLAALGARLDARGAAAVFFVGQLGKYVPGSVWSFAVQAQLGRRHAVPMRSSVTASALFLLVHTLTGVVLGAGCVAVGVIDLPGSRWWWLVAVVGGVVALLPPVVRLLGDRLAGDGVRTRFGARELVVSALLMAAVWTCYGVGMLLLVTGVAGPAADLGGDAVVAAVGGFALAHAAGVLLILAPAGLGAREGVLIAVLTPFLGVGPAAAAALLSRVAHAIADFLLAAVAGAAGAAGRAASVAPDAELPVSDAAAVSDRTT